MPRPMATPINADHYLHPNGGLMTVRLRWQDAAAFEIIAEHLSAKSGRRIIGKSEAFRKALSLAIDHLHAEAQALC
jgi:hypothetical protein